MWGTCCTCAAMFTFDGPRVLGSNCLATGAAAGWTVTKLKTSNRRGDTTRAVNDAPLPSVVPPQPNRCSPVGQLDTAPFQQRLYEGYLCSGSYSGQQKSSALHLFQSDRPFKQKTEVSLTNIP